MDKETKYVLFHKQGEYNGVTYEVGKTYKVVDEPAGFVVRWVKRGCEIVEAPEKYEIDPRFPALEKNPLILELKDVAMEEDKPKKVATKKKTITRKKVKKVDKVVDKEENKEELV